MIHMKVSVRMKDGKKMKIIVIHMKVKSKNEWESVYFLSPFSIRVKNGDTMDYINVKYYLFFYNIYLFIYYFKNNSGNKKKKKKKKGCVEMLLL